MRNTLNNWFILPSNSETNRALEIRKSNVLFWKINFSRKRTIPQKQLSIVRRLKSICRKLKFNQLTKWHIIHVESININVWALECLWMNQQLLLPNLPSTRLIFIHKCVAGEIEMCADKVYNLWATKC